MKKSRKIISLLSVLALLVLTVSISYAWFFTYNELEINSDNEISCETGESLSISMKEEFGTNWSDYGLKVSSKYKANLKDISGDGNNLYSPSNLVVDEHGNLVPTILEPAKPIDSTGVGDYVELEIKIRSKSTVEIYLDNNSSIIPLLADPNEHNIFGDFSKDYIAGALRVAILERKESLPDELKMIWSPNPKIELSKNKETGIYQLNTNGKVEHHQYYKDDNGKPLLYRISTSDAAEKKFVVGSNLATPTFANDAPMLAKIEPKLGEFGYAHLVVRIWFEGTDREASEALAGGKTKMNLKFIGLNAKAPALASSKDLLNNINYDGEKIVNLKQNSDVPILFTVNGFMWYEYDPQDQTSTSIFELEKYVKTHTNETVIAYFKISETEREKDYLVKISIKYGVRSQVVEV